MLNITKSLKQIMLTVDIHKSAHDDILNPILENPIFEGTPISFGKNNTFLHNKTA